jgi:V-type H+-transporting ATPase subunit a
MKLAVILGITQMTGGVILRGINSVYFRQWLDFYCEFIPMMIFDLSFFGYMLILIFVKWSINWNNRMSMGSCAYDSDGTFGGCNLSTNTTCFTYGGATCDSTTMLVDMCPLGMGGSSQGCQPPNLITTLMNMALAPGSVDEPLYTGQAGVQTFLLLMAFFSVPVLLCAKPYILKKKHEEAQKLIAASNAVTVDALNASRHSEEDGNIDNPLLASLKAEAGTAKEDGKVVLGEGDMHTGAKDHGGAAASDAHGGGHGHGDEFNFGEIMIHQAIETIEFVLGMVSNTASYLRLWALSLAHSELAEVFWSKALLGAVSMGSPVAIYVGFAVFAAVTFAVLLAMDVLECFLHALRLHWVEFQNKFFRADGHKFQPFDFRSIIARALLE